VGEKKVSIRTLANGDKVRHHPDGTMILLERNRMAEKLDTQAEEHRAASAALLKKRLVAVEVKRAKQLSGDPVPPDKIPL
jgi:hypothetical protein